jgi:hypothetical protein
VSGAVTAVQLVLNMFAVVAVKNGRDTTGRARVIHDLSRRLKVAGRALIVLFRTRIGLRSRVQKLPLLTLVKKTNPAHRPSGFGSTHTQEAT